LDGNVMAGGRKPQMLASKPTLVAQSAEQEKKEGRHKKRG